ncbi:MAG: radical SAM protein [Planctomycetota bacterium]
MQTVVEVDEQRYVMVAAMLAGAGYREIAECLAVRGFEASVGQIHDTLVEYRDLGLFRAPDAARQSAEISNTMMRLSAHQPMKMMLFMAQSCNLRCTYCYGIEGNYVDKGEKMSPETAEAAVDYLMLNSPQRRHFYIYFFGGEPLLNFETIQHTVKYARQRAAELRKTVEFGITTNGTLLSDKVVDFLVQEDFQICVSMDGSPEGHDVNRPTKGGSGSHRHVLAGIRKLQAVCKRPGQLKIRATMSHQNHDPLAISRYFDASGITNYGIGTTFHRAGNTQGTDVTPDDMVEMDQVLDNALDEVVQALAEGRRTPRYNPFYKTVGSMSMGSTKAFIGCGVCRNDQGIGTDGRIYPCHRYVGLDSYVIGDVRSGVDPEKVRAVYKQVFDLWMNHCRNCWARYTCSSACVWQHSHDDGNLRIPDRDQCHAIRRSVRRSAWLSLHLSQKHPDVLAALSRAPAAGGCCNPQ